MAGTFKYSEVFTSEALDLFYSLLRRGMIDRAISLFIDKLPRDMAQRWEQQVRSRMVYAAAQELKLAEINKIATQLSIVTRDTMKTITESVRVFSTDVIGKYVFQVNKITAPNVKKAILDATLGQFETYINGAMGGTPAHILNDIRQIQRDWIVRNQALRHTGDADRLLMQSEAEFRAMLKTKYPQYFRGIEEGKILRSRPLGPNLDKFRYFTLDEYIDMSVRATVLNIDRQAVEVSSQLSGDRVVEYYLRDTRKILTEERDVCNQILKKKIHGKSLLALDQETGRLLGIYTVDKAKELGAMFIHCRHSIRRLDPEFRDQLEKVLFLKQQATQRLTSSAGGDI